jgi:hypothetical protein
MKQIPKIKKTQKIKNEKVKLKKKILNEKEKEKKNKKIEIVENSIVDLEVVGTSRRIEGLK